MPLHKEVLATSSQASCHKIFLHHYNIEISCMYTQYNAYNLKDLINKLLHKNTPKKMTLNLDIMMVLHSWTRPSYHLQLNFSKKWRYYILQTVFRLSFVLLIQWLKVFRCTLDISILMYLWTYIAMFTSDLTLYYHWR